MIVSRLTISLQRLFLRNAKILLSLSVRPAWCLCASVKQDTNGLVERTPSTFIGSPEYSELCISSGGNEIWNTHTVSVAFGRILEAQFALRNNCENISDIVTRLQLPRTRMNWTCIPHFMRGGVSEQILATCVYGGEHISLDCYGNEADAYGAAALLAQRAMHHSMQMSPFQ